MERECRKQMLFENLSAHKVLFTAWWMWEKTWLEIAENTNIFLISYISMVCKSIWTEKRILNSDIMFWNCFCKFQFSWNLRCSPSSNWSSFGIAMGDLFHCDWLACHCDVIKHFTHCTIPRESRGILHKVGSLLLYDTFINIQYI